MIVLVVHLLRLLHARTTGIFTKLGSWPHHGQNCGQWAQYAFTDELLTLLHPADVQTVPSGALRLANTPLAWRANLPSRLQNWFPQAPAAIRLGGMHSVSRWICVARDPQSHDHQTVQNCMLAGAAVGLPVHLGATHSGCRNGGVKVPSASLRRLENLFQRCPCGSCAYYVIATTLSRATAISCAWMQTCCVRRHLPRRRLRSSVANCMFQMVEACLPRQIGQRRLRTNGTPCAPYATLG